ncbi:MAG: hypothetical protein EZS28_013191 [Streblomastix strix]|uniref:Uncharacterized protein n=1 Tax=Streblomastix strix TaxID=222440 RepID=A0A5J4W9F3_9EUKA|nr:MAG: hypothetical protein EZS28_013191 [Streblomastix strix]
MQHPSLLQTPPLKIEQMQFVQQSVRQYKNVKQPALNLFVQFSSALRAVRSILEQESDMITREFKNINKDIQTNISQLINILITEPEDIDLMILSGLILEIIDIVRRTPIDQVPWKLLLTLNKITEIGSTEQVHVIKEMKIMQIFAPSLKHSDEDIQKEVLEVINNIIKKGWNMVIDIYKATSWQSQMSTGDRAIGYNQDHQRENIDEQEDPQLYYARFANFIGFTLYTWILVSN